MKTVRSKGHIVVIPCKWMILFVAGLLMAGSAGATEVWNGPTITFVQSGSSVDQLTPAVWITRGGAQGIYNAVTETSYTHNFSPDDTEWAFGELTNYATLTYTNWESMFGGSGGGGPPSTVGKDCVVHLISDDIYLSVQFTAWTARSGGFTYVRSTAPIPPPSFQSIAISSNTVAFTWNATIGQGYHFQYSTNLASTNWTDLVGSITATNSTMNTSDTNAVTGSARRFYRISMP